MSATSLLSSAVVKVLPELIVPVDSGPSSPLLMSTPVTVKLLVLKLDVPPPVNPPPPPPPPPAPPPPPPPPAPPVVPPVLKAGTVPFTVRSVSVSPPAAAATLSILEIAVTSEALIEERVRSEVSVLSLILLPAAGRLAVPLSCRKQKPTPPPPAAPAVGVFVTVMSVPTPYRECSTVP